MWKYSGFLSTKNLGRAPKIPCGCWFVQSFLGWRRLSEGRFFERFSKEVSKCFPPTFSSHISLWNDMVIKGYRENLSIPFFFFFKWVRCKQELGSSQYCPCCLASGDSFLPLGDRVPSFKFQKENHNMIVTETFGELSRVDVAFLLDHQDCSWSKTLQSL